MQELLKNCKFHPGKTIDGSLLKPVSEHLWGNAGRIHTFKQNRIQKLAFDSTMPEDCLTAMIIKGLQDSYKDAMPQFTRTIEQLTAFGLQHQLPK